MTCTSPINNVDKRIIGQRHFVARVRFYNHPITTRKKFKERKKRRRQKKIIENQYLTAAESEKEIE